MRNTGIFTAKEVGEWIINTLKTKIQQNDLAQKLAEFLENQGNYSITLTKFKKFRKKAT